MDAITTYTIIAQDNKLFKGSGNLSTFTEITGAIVDTSDNMSMCGIFQKVFVANGTNKLVIDFLNNKIGYATGLTTAPVAGDTLTQLTTNARAIVDYVSPDKKYVYATKITTEDFDTTAGHTISSDNAGGVTMSPSTFLPSSITKPTEPHQSTWSMHPANTVPLPDRFYLVCEYNGRIVISGNPEDPGAWAMTRQGNPFDLDFTVNSDLQSPVMSSNADYGKIGDIVKALIRWHDDYIIFGCQNSIHYIQGDPMAGGSRLQLTDKVGIFGDKSFCFDGDGNLWFYGTGGLYTMSVGKGVSAPVNITTNILAKFVETIDADPHTHSVCMGFDVKRNGIKLTSTNTTTGVNTGYWIQIKPFGVWPESVDETISCYSMLEYNDTDPSNSGLLLGCKDGFIRTESSDDKDDEGTSVAIPIESELLLPVIPIGENSYTSGKINSTCIVTSGGSAGGSLADTDEVTASFYRGDTCEDIIEQVEGGETPAGEYTLTGGGKQARIRNKFSSRAIGIKLSNIIEDSSWSVESAEIEIVKSGRN